MIQNYILSPDTRDLSSDGLNWPHSSLEILAQVNAVFWPCFKQPNYRPSPFKWLTAFVNAEIMKSRYWRECIRTCMYLSKKTLLHN